MLKMKNNGIGDVGLCNFVTELDETEADKDLGLGLFVIQGILIEEPLIKSNKLTFENEISEEEMDIESVNFCSGEKINCDGNSPCSFSEVTGVGRLKNQVLIKDINAVMDLEEVVKSEAFDFQDIKIEEEEITFETEIKKEIVQFEQEGLWSEEEVNYERNYFCSLNKENVMKNRALTRSLSKNKLKVSKNKKNKFSTGSTVHSDSELEDISFTLDSPFEAHQEICKIEDESNKKFLPPLERDGELQFSSPIEKSLLVCSLCHFYSNNPKDVSEHLGILHAIYDSKVSAKAVKIPLDYGMYVENGLKLYKCFICDKKFKDKTGINRHLRRYNLKYIIYCPLCTYGSANRSSLDTHIRSHKVKKKFKCPRCNFKADNNSNLERHLRTHDGKKPLTCTYCKYRASYASALNVHVKRHTGEKPYTCPHCSYKCLLRMDLLRHIAIHTHEKPFFCFVCNFKCIRFDRLEVHVSQHKRSLMKCAFCCYETHQGICMVSHLKAKHKHGWNKTFYGKNYFNNNKIVIKKNVTDSRQLTKIQL